MEYYYEPAYVRPPMPVYHEEYYEAPAYVRPPMQVYQEEYYEEPVYVRPAITQNYEEYYEESAPVRPQGSSYNEYEEYYEESAPVRRQGASYEEYETDDNYSNFRNRNNSSSDIESEYEQEQLNYGRFNSGSDSEETLFNGRNWPLEQSDEYNPPNRANTGFTEENTDESSSLVEWNGWNPRSSSSTSLADIEENYNQFQSRTQIEDYEDSSLGGNTSNWSLNQNGSVARYEQDEFDFNAALQKSGVLNEEGPLVKWQGWNPALEGSSTEDTPIGNRSARSVNNESSELVSESDAQKNRTPTGSWSLNSGETLETLESVENLPKLTSSNGVKSREAIIEELMLENGKTSYTFGPNGSIERVETSTRLVEDAPQFNTQRTIQGENGETITQNLKAQKVGFSNNGVWKEMLVYLPDGTTPNGVKQPNTSPNEAMEFEAAQVNLSRSNNKGATGQTGTNVDSEIANNESNIASTTKFFNDAEVEGNSFYKNGNGNTLIKGAAYYGEIAESTDDNGNKSYFRTINQDGKEVGRFTVGEDGSLDLNRTNNGKTIAISVKANGDQILTQPNGQIFKVNNGTEEVLQSDGSFKPVTFKNTEVYGIQTGAKIESNETSLLFRLQNYEDGSVQKTSYKTDLGLKMDAGFVSTGSATIKEFTSPAGQMTTDIEYDNGMRSTITKQNLETPFEFNTQGNVKSSIAAGTEVTKIISYDSNGKIVGELVNDGKGFVGQQTVKVPTYGGTPYTIEKMYSRDQSGLSVITKDDRMPSVTQTVRKENNGNTIVTTDNVLNKQNYPMFNVRETIESYIGKEGNSALISSRGLTGSMTSKVEVFADDGSPIKSIYNTGEKIEAYDDNGSSSKFVTGKTIEVDHLNNLMKITNPNNSNDTTIIPVKGANQGNPYSFTAKDGLVTTEFQTLNNTRLNANTLNPGSIASQKISYSDAEAGTTGEFTRVINTQRLVEDSVENISADGKNYSVRQNVDGEMFAFWRNTDGTNGSSPVSVKYEGNTLSDMAKRPIAEYSINDNGKNVIVKSLNAMQDYGLDQIKNNFGNDKSTAYYQDAKPLFTNAQYSGKLDQSGDKIWNMTMSNGSIKQLSGDSPQVDNFLKSNPEIEHYEKINSLGGGRLLSITTSLESSEQGTQYKLDFESASTTVTNKAIVDGYLKNSTLNQSKSDVGFTDKGNPILKYVYTDSATGESIEQIVISNKLINLKDTLDIKAENIDTRTIISGSSGPQWFDSTNGTGNNYSLEYVNPLVFGFAALKRAAINDNWKAPANASTASIKFIQTLNRISEGNPDKLDALKQNGVFWSSAINNSLKTELEGLYFDMSTPALESNQPLTDQLRFFNSAGQLRNQFGALIPTFKTGAPILPEVEATQMPMIRTTTTNAAGEETSTEVRRPYLVNGDVGVNSFARFTATASLIQNSMDGITVGEVLAAPIIIRDMLALNGETYFNTNSPNFNKAQQMIGGPVGKVALNSLGSLASIPSAAIAIANAVKSDNPYVQASESFNAIRFTAIAGALVTASVPVYNGSEPVRQLAYSTYRGVNDVLDTFKNTGRYTVNPPTSPKSLAVIPKATTAQWGLAGRILNYTAASAGTVAGWIDTAGAVRAMNSAENATDYNAYRNTAIINGVGAGLNTVSLVAPAAATAAAAAFPQIAALGVIAGATAPILMGAGAVVGVGMVVAQDIITTNQAADNIRFNAGNVAINNQFLKPTFGYQPTIAGPSAPNWSTTVSNINTTISRYRNFMQ